MLWEPNQLNNKILFCSKSPDINLEEITSCEGNANGTAPPDMQCEPEPGSLVCPCMSKYEINLIVNLWNPKEPSSVRMERTRHDRLSQTGSYVVEVLHQLSLKLTVVGLFCQQIYLFSLFFMNRRPLGKCIVDLSLGFKKRKFFS